MKNKIKVLIVDDSAVVRQTLEAIMSSDPDLEVIDTAADPYIAVQKIRKQKPDVISLDLEMPRMDGLTFLRELMSQHPIPVVVCSSLTEKGAETTLQALQYGAVEIINKPQLGVKQYLEEARILICDAIKAASKTGARKPRPARAIEPKLSADAVIQKGRPKGLVKTTETVVALGASTGGTEAIRQFLEELPYDSPGIVIVQHMPEHFTAAFARRLNSQCRIDVREARDNDTVVPGLALIAPGNKHMMLKRSGARYYVEIKDGPLVNRHRPSVDVLFRSAARYGGKNVLGVIMTGMGADGAKGMLEMKEAGAFTVAQDEASCVVYGMPGEAVALGAADKVIPLDHISKTIMMKYNARDGRNPG